MSLKQKESLKQPGKRSLRAEYLNGSVSAFFLNKEFSEKRKPWPSALVTGHYWSLHRPTLENSFRSSILTEMQIKLAHGSNEIVDVKKARLYCARKQR